MGRCNLLVGTPVQLHPLPFHENRLRERFGKIAGYDISRSKYQVHLFSYGRYMTSFVMWMFDNEVSAVGEEAR